MKVNYEYKVAGIPTSTREAARLIQRSLRSATPEAKAPRIVQKITMERIVR
jgi:hypothetical protein